jgi:hypothetical protein
MRRDLVRAALAVMALSWGPLAPAAEPDTFGAGQSLATLDSMALPGVGDQVKFTAADQFTYDDNLYRLPSDVANVASLIGPGSSRGDHLNTATLGTNGQWVYGAQAVGFLANIADNRYSRNTDLDNVSGNAKAVLDWRAGRIWLGEVGADYSRSLAGAANSKFFARDLIDQSEYFGTALLSIGQYWNLIGGVRYADSTHSASVRSFEDNHKTTENFGIEYVSLSDNTGALEYRHTEGRFSQGILVDDAPFNQDYVEDSERFLVKYQLSGDLLFDGSAGYLKRTYPESPVGSFAGNVWRATVSWQATAKTQVAFAGWRELGSYIDSESDYFVSTGWSVSPTFNATNKIAMMLTYSSTRQTYLASNTSADAASLAPGSRHDKREFEEAVVTYTRRAVVVKLTLNLDHRESNQNEFQYDDKLASASVAVKF